MGKERQKKGRASASRNWGHKMRIPKKLVPFQEMFPFWGKERDNTAGAQGYTQDVAPESASQHDTDVHRTDATATASSSSNDCLPPLTPYLPLLPLPPVGTSDGAHQETRDSTSETVALRPLQKDTGGEHTISYSASPDTLGADQHEWTTPTTASLNTSPPSSGSPLPLSASFPSFDPRACEYEAHLPPYAEVYNSGSYRLSPFASEQTSVTLGHGPSNFDPLQSSPGARLPRSMPSLDFLQVRSHEGMSMATSGHAESSRLAQPCYPSPFASPNTIPDLPANNCSDISGTSLYGYYNTAYGSNQAGLSTSAMHARRTHGRAAPYPSRTPSNHRHGAASLLALGRGPQAGRFSNTLGVYTSPHFHPIPPNNDPIPPNNDPIPLSHGPITPNYDPLLPPGPMYLDVGTSSSGGYRASGYPPDRFNLLPPPMPPSAMLSSRSLPIDTWDGATMDHRLPSPMVSVRHPEDLWPGLGVPSAGADGGSEAAADNAPSTMEPGDRAWDYLPQGEYKSDGYSTTDDPTS